jgi:hypothetical protein
LFLNGLVFIFSKNLLHPHKDANHVTTAALEITRSIKNRDTLKAPGKSMKKQTN